MSDHPTINYDRLMQANFALFSERDPVRRIEAIRELSAAGGVLHEPDASAKGHAAISEAVTAPLASLPPDFIFRTAGPAVGHHGVGRLNRHAGPAVGPVAVTGTDVAHSEGDLIRTLHVLLDPASR